MVTTGLSLLLYLTGFFVIFTPLPLIFCALRRGFLPASVSLTLGLLVLGALYRISSPPLTFLPLVGFYPRWGITQVTVLSLIYFFYYGWLGVTVSAASRTSASLEKGVLGILASAVLIPALLLVGFSKAMEVHLVEEFRSSLSYFFDRMVGMQEKSGPGGDEMLFLKEYLPVIVTRVVEVMPALWINLTLLIASLNIIFVRRWLAQKRPFSAWIDYSLWRLRERWIWLPIVTGALYFLNLYLVQSNPVRTTLINVLLVLGAVYFFQGLSVVSFFFRKKFSPFVRMMAYLVILLFVQTVGIVIVALGVFDFWFDFRKLKRIGGS